MINQAPCGFSGPFTLGASTKAPSTTGSFKQSILLDESVHLMSVHTWSVNI